MLSPGPDCFSSLVTLRNALSFLPAPALGGSMAKEKVLKKATVSDLRRELVKLQKENAELKALAQDSESY